MDEKVRINKYLSDKKICSRREADRLIEKGLILINGKKAVKGQKVGAKDKVLLKKEVVKKPGYYVLHKPVGVVSHKTAPGQKEAREIARLPKSYAPVGRLDKKSCGLLLLTNDGRIVNRLLSPEFGHEREYIVEVDKYIKESDLKKLARGVDIEGYRTKPCKVRRLGEKKFSMILKEGKKHQIRRMLAALGYVVKFLKRTRIMHIRLGKLPEGRARRLTKREKDELLRALGLL